MRREDSGKRIYFWILILSSFSHPRAFRTTSDFALNALHSWGLADSWCSMTTVEWLYAVCRSASTQSPRHP